MPHLNDRMVSALKAPSAGYVVIPDSRLVGLGVRVTAAGAKAFVVNYRNAHGQSRRLTLGRVGVFDVDEARKRARKVLAAVADGADPAADRRATSAAVTVAQFCDDYLETERAAGRIKPSTLAMDTSRVSAHVKPLLGHRPVASLTAADIEKFLADVRAGKSGGKARKGRGGVTSGGAGVASRTVGMLGTILQKAVRDGLLASNPVRGVRRPKDGQRQPVFSFKRVTALGAAIVERGLEGDNLRGLSAIRALLLTGARRNEILTLRWRDIDAGAQCLRLVDTKSGQQTRPIGKTALDHLLSFKPSEAKPSDWVFPGDTLGGHLVGLPKIWARVTATAKIEDVSLHGLRHWFASAAAEMNFSELTIAGLLGHRVKGVTARYATTPDSALLAAADRVSARLAAALAGQTAEASPLSKTAP